MDIDELPRDKKIVLFDGICNLCEASVQYIIKRDKKDLFRFVPIQSELGQNIIKHIGIINSSIDSIVFYEPGKAYYLKAEAVLTIVISFGGIYSFWKLFLLIPKSILNTVYDYIARNRYAWYGKKDNCMIPTPEIMAKFLV
jgi:predicted DCC family thiol-disulfide oxidoreductase YuxK